MLDAGYIRDFGLKYRAELNRFVINYRSIKKRFKDGIDQSTNIKIETKLIDIIEKFERLSTNTDNFR